MPDYMITDKFKFTDSIAVNRPIEDAVTLKRYNGIGIAIGGNGPHDFCEWNSGTNSWEFFPWAHYYWTDSEGARVLDSNYYVRDVVLKYPPAL